MKFLLFLTSLPLILTLWRSSSTAAAAQAALGGPAPDFVLKDQYDHEVRLSQLRGQVVLLVYGDSEGTNFFQSWVATVRQKFPADKVRLVPIVNFDGGVPGFMHGHVAGKFQGKTPDGQPKTSKLMDWDGVIAKQYGAVKKLTNVYLVDRQGNLKFTASGKGTADDTEGLMQSIAIALK
ncbi:MAG TPA: redoxin domain-containing protein [Blastocatellia bacterium]|nr:redoxin domain-containing protein [Blastocatellia bacterium]